MSNHNGLTLEGYLAKGCWAAFRSGVFPTMVDQDRYSMLSTFEEFGSGLVNITYFKPQCAQYANSTGLSSLYGSEISDDDHASQLYSVGNCTLGRNVFCELEGSEAKECRLSIRMFAAFTLAGCLTIKAIYMIIINIRARGKIKTDCLTFGDVIVASALNTDLQIRNECLLNAGEGNRHRTDHTCHKHCRDPQSSMTGDGIGHCQKCAKFNIVDKAVDLLHPCIAIKYKKSLLANLGSTAISQMIILTICSLGMLTGSITLAVLVGSSASDFKRTCSDHSSYPSSYQSHCTDGLQSYLKHTFGSFGGLNSSAALAGLPNSSLRGEIAAFAVSNGTQLLFSALYLLLIYNITLISIEHDWGKFEKQRQRPRCTLVRGNAFEQSYLLQLPKKVLFPVMAFSAVMHWLLGQAISTREVILANDTDPLKWERSQYTVGAPLFKYHACGGADIN